MGIKGKTSRMIVSEYLSGRAPVLKPENLGLGPCLDRMFPFQLYKAIFKFKF